MNQYFKHLILSMLIVPFMGCSSDMPEELAGGKELEAVRFHLSFSGMEGRPDTRSLAPDYRYSDGSSINVLKAYVYNQTSGVTAAPVKIMDIDIKDVNEHKGGDISILLPKGEKYDLIFLGTSIPQGDPAGKLYYDSNERTVTVNYAASSCNDEELDCFFAAAKDVTTETTFDNNVVLSRPFAQINVGTQDYESYSATTPIKDISMTIDGIYDKFSLMDGSVVGDPQTIAIPAGAFPDDNQVFPIDGFRYLSMNYVLVNLRKLVNVDITVYHTDESVADKSIKINEVGAERNYQTNIYGKKLLSEKRQQ